MINLNDFLIENFDKEEMSALLKRADEDPLLEGFVYPSDDSRKRFPIFYESVLVGFATPRQDKDSIWRMGAIYIAPEFRNRKIAQMAIAEFMSDKKGRAFIENDNIQSQRAYQAAGFRIVRKDAKNKGCWWENF
jgi:RimJ/RimL family protein N-acetyltransferase